MVISAKVDANAVNVVEVTRATKIITTKLKRVLILFLLLEEKNEENRGVLLWWAL